MAGLYGSSGPNGKMADANAPVVPSVSAPAAFHFAAEAEAGVLPQRMSPFATPPCPDGGQVAHPTASGDERSGISELTAGLQGSPDCAPRSPVAASEGHNHALPGLLLTLLSDILPALLPAAKHAALEASSASPAAQQIPTNQLRSVLDAALPAALATALPEALSAMLPVILRAAAAPPALGPAAARQSSLEQQSAAEQQLVRMLFEGDAGDTEPAPPAKTSSRASSEAEDGPVTTSSTAAPATSAAVPVERVLHRPASATNANVAVASATNTRSATPNGDAASLRSLSLVAASVPGRHSGSASSPRDGPKSNGQQQPNPPAQQQQSQANSSSQPPLFSRSSLGSVGGHAGMSTTSWGAGDDAHSHSDEACSTCSAADVPSPFTAGDISAHVGNGSNAPNSGTNTFVVQPEAAAPEAQQARRGVSSAAGNSCFTLSSEALLDRLQELQPSSGSPAAELLVAAGRLQSTQDATVAALLAQQKQHQQQHSQAQAQAQQLQQLQQLQQQQQQAQQQLQMLSSLAGFSPNSSTVLPLGGDVSQDLAGALLAGGAGGNQWRRNSGTSGPGCTLPGLTDVWTGATSGTLSDSDALASIATLAQCQQQQQQQQLLAAVAAANGVRGNAFRPEDIITLGAGTGAAGLPLGVAIAGAGELGAVMDAVLRRMVLVSAQVAAELARACASFSGAQAQLHHLCCVIAEQLVDVAAMAPEVASALLRALAAHRTRGAQATDVDPRVMGRILQLLRAGPAGRHLCLVSLEQWVDGLSRIHKRRAYLDTILHNYQLTLKRLVQAMGHQVHAVNMSLPRQLLNELSPRALLQLTAELASYPLLQPRRWSEEIIWTVSQLHAMGADMVLGNAPATANGNGAGAGASGANNGSLCAFQWEVRRALAAAAEDVGTRPDGTPASPPSGCPTQQSATCPSGTAVPWAAHAALHRHLLLGLRRVQTRYFVERLQRNQGLYGEAVEAMLRSSLPQDVMVPEREVVVVAAALLLVECRLRPEDFDAAFGRELQRLLAVVPPEDVAARLRCGLVPESPLRIADPLDAQHKSRALSQLLKLGVGSGAAALVGPSANQMLVAGPGMGLGVGVGQSALQQHLQMQAAAAQLAAAQQLQQQQLHQLQTAQMQAAVQMQAAAAAAAAYGLQ